MQNKERRILWLLNHKTLMPFEVPLLQSLGFEVFTPKVIPNHTGDFRSTIVDFSYDSGLTIPDDVLRKLNSFDFYADRPWPSDITAALNHYFGIAITCIMKYPFQGIMTGFSGKVIMRVFGVDNTMTYGKVLHLIFGEQVDSWLEAVKDRFWFGESYEQLAECEATFLRDRALFLPVGIPQSVWRFQNTWQGTDKQVLFVCSNINDNPYYTKVYRDFKEQFGDFPHVIVGQQGSPVSDSHVLANVRDDQLRELFQRSKVLYYHSHEARHLHYAPVEAAIFGTPVVFYRDSLLRRIAGDEVHGAVDNIHHARELVSRLLQSDCETVESLRQSQHVLQCSFTREYCERTFRRNLSKHGFLLPS
ncbi:hypothetical protein [Alicyclobacillus sp. ALC3]|uniref:hypothetical protein n=1 Tax=Alicyclobacillus sp. ALC3 TaxID=2796143 RepID=UPI002378C474|nr:hypothetical protein [Alicyclobacillus sp. ALC3]WDL95155.1 hypothetical protein JC200_12035 [Alicyclobacillus sp. ALC3]